MTQNQTGGKNPYSEKIPHILNLAPVVSDIICKTYLAEFGEFGLDGFKVTLASFAPCSFHPMPKSNQLISHRKSKLNLKKSNPKSSYSRAF